MTIHDNKKPPKPPVSKRKGRTEGTEEWPLSKREEYNLKRAGRPPEDGVLYRVYRRDGAYCLQIDRKTVCTDLLPIVIDKLVSDLSRRYGLW